MRALIAFDKFKDSLTAREACDLTARALRDRHPDWSLDLCPLADGGEGFAEILTRATGGKMVRHRVDGPRGTPLDAAFGLVNWEKIPPAAQHLLQLQTPYSVLQSSSVAVIEMAAASGLALLPTDARDPWQASTAGTGQLIRAAAEAGAIGVLLGVGGSATNDLGFGALNALGLDFLSADGQAVRPPIPAHWNRITKIDGAAPRSLPPIRIACDVTNPLLGPQGAAAIYGPQKGLRPEDRKRIEHESARLALMLCNHCRQSDSLMDLPGAGAAGGLPFGLMAATGARLLPGFDLVSTWLDLEAKIAAADVIITGEGRFDQSSLSGKGPGAVAARGRALGKPVHVFAGAVTASTQDGLALHAITPAGTPLPEALRTAGTNLQTAVAANC
ncbi:MAG TPA: glycerate kinase [Lacunisphaera sp.]|nr:glycerate kinase [Lacunisphaera sp.]